jgi:uncharacterized protein YoxC
MTTAKTSSFLCGILGVVLIAGQVSANETMARMTDDDVEGLAKTIGKQYQAFERAIDSKLKRSILRGPGGEVQVEYYLNDLGDSIEQLGDRFTGSYSASGEATDVLNRADFMNSYVHDNPSMKGANEWDVLGASLQQLASAYGTSFPLPGDAAARRIGDGELEDAATALSKFSKEMPRTVKKETRGMDEISEAVDGLESELKSMSDLSKTLASRIRTGKPATAEARQVMESAANIELLLETEDMPASVKDAWAAGSNNVEKVAQAFNL